MTAGLPRIIATDVFKSFGAGEKKALILRGVSLAIAPGEIVFLVGPSGSGKTTLLSVMGCILTPDEGSLKILGQEISGMNAQQRAVFRRDRLGFIFQSFNLFPNLSALDNIRLTLCMRGVAMPAATQEASDLLNQLGVGHRSHLRPASLSGGECQRVAIARSLAGSPQILYADEPTAALDAENGRNVMVLLSDLVRKRGLTLLVVTHDTRIFPFADRILTLEDGCLSHEWAPDLADPNATQEFVVRRGLPPGRLRFLRANQR